MLNHEQRDEAVDLMEQFRAAFEKEGHTVSEQTTEGYSNVATAIRIQLKEVAGGVVDDVFLYIPLLIDGLGLAAVANLKEPLEPMGSYPHDVPCATKNPKFTQAATETREALERVLKTINPGLNLDNHSWELWGEQPKGRITLTIIEGTHGQCVKGRTLEDEKKQEAQWWTTSPKAKLVSRTRPAV